MAAESLPEVPRRRLEDIPQEALDPFVRAPSVTDSSVYWMPVSQFPMLPHAREWLNEFHTRLAQELRNTASLREEVFLQFKSLYPNLINRFTETSSEYLPLTGISLRPGAEPTRLPDLESIRKQVEDAQKHGTGVDTDRWTPDYLHWFARKRPAAQRADFLGYGGLLTLYLEPDAGTTAPTVEMPGFVKKLNVYDPNMQQDIDAAYSLRDEFLTRSKEVFGSAFQNDPAYKGMMFILPLLTSDVALSALPVDRAEWFKVFHGYLAESRGDGGMLLVLKDPNFDDPLRLLLRGMREDGFTYRG